jgi:nucleotide-binding universal stress UspA family protein
MPAPILVGYDPRSRAPGPVVFGAGAARLTGAPLLVVSVHGGDSSTHGAAADELGGGTRDAAHGAVEGLERAIPELAEVSAEVRAVDGHSAPRALHRLAEEEGAGLVVVGASTRGRSARALLGSTAERVIHGAPCPVAIVPGDLERTTLGVVGVAFVPSPEGREALHAGSVIADAAGAQLRIIALLKPELGAVEGAHADPRGVRTNEERAETAATHQAALLAAIAEARTATPVGREPQVDVQFGEPEQTLVDVSRHLDLLVMGSRGYGPRLAVLLGGVSRRVAAQAQCPVLVIPRGASRPLEDLLLGDARVDARS